LALSRLPILNAVAFACAAIVVPASASPPEVVFERAAPSVLVVERIDRNGRRNGFASGVVTGLSQVVTSCHALSGAAGARVRSGERSHAAALVRADPERDLCRLSVEGLDAPPARIVPAGMLRVGQRVYAVGTPKGLERTISEGIISSLRPRARSFVIQTTAPMSRGSSGGGLFDPSGQLVGIVTFQHRYGQNLNFALPADWIGQMRTRSASTSAASEVAGRAAPAGAQRAAADSPAALIVGTWACFGSVSGRSGTYTYGANGAVSFVTNDGVRGKGSYAVSGKTVRYSLPGGSFAYAIEHLDAGRMVLNIGSAGQRLACERR
jgi:S1-C subfamily serine protease